MKTEHPNSSHLIPSGNQAATVSTPRMDPAIKARWVAALRSGKYKQGKGVLRSFDNEFCCLGVLCDLYATDSGEQWGPRLRWEGTAEFPGEEVCIWAGLPDEAPGVPVGVLHMLNDDGWSFARIADAIEAQL